MVGLKKTVAVKQRPLNSDLSSDSKQPKQPIAVVIRRQTLEEERQFHAALELLLADLVRQHFDREGKP